MKDFVSYKGVAKEIHGSRDSIRYALQFNIIENGQMWIDMIEDRNRAAHAYDENNAAGLTKRIIEFYVEEFNKFENKMDGF
jgi:nucleotidyltransferase substrate binding protein (TIGR01987 family)